MKLLSIALLISLWLGQIGRLPIGQTTVYLHDIVIFIALVVLIVQRKREIIRITTPMLLFMTGFVAVAALSMVISPVDVLPSILYLARWILYAKLIYVSATELKIRDWLMWLYAYGIGFAVIGFLQLMLYPDLRNLTYLGWDPHNWRLVSSLLDPNFTGILLVISFFIGLVLFRLMKRPVGIVVGQIILLSAIFLTYSRSSIVALCAGLLVLFLLQYRRFVLPLVLALLVLGIAVFIPKPGGDTLRFDRAGSTLARVSNWQQSIALFTQSPVFGLGFSPEARISSGDGAEPNVPTRAGAGIDSSLLFILLSTGLVGFIFYAGIFVQTAAIATRLGSKELGATVVAILVAVLVNSFFINSLLYPWVMVALWLIIGIVLRATNKKEVI